MGNKSIAKLRPDELYDYRRTTAFNEAEIRM